MEGGKYRMKDPPRRKPMRLEGWDYRTPGASFVTLCTQNRIRIFGRVVGDKVVLSDMGTIVSESWIWLVEEYDFVDLDSFVVMPDHLHGILMLVEVRKGGSRTAPTTISKPLGRLVWAFKTVSTRCINHHRGTPSV